MASLSDSDIPDTIPACSGDCLYTYTNGAWVEDPNIQCDDTTNCMCPGAPTDPGDEGEQRWIPCVQRFKVLPRSQKKR